ncbi:MAG: class I adenylate cyclase [Desulfovibrionaceae bacterium]|nr:class I adenylate cyclase [Desulfovibrionaceae bacterium]
MPTPPLDILTAILRRAVFALAGPDLTTLLPLMHQAVAFLEREPHSSPAAGGYVADMASLAAAMLEESRSPAFIRSGLEILLRLGRVGELMAVSFAEKNVLSGEHLGAVLGGLAPEARLLLANAILRYPRNRRPELARFAQNALETAIDQNPDDILVLLDTLRQRSDRPAAPIRDACLHGRLGLWMERLVKMDLSPEQVAFMSRMAAALRSGELAEPLLRAADGPGDEARKELLQAIIEQPCPPRRDLASHLKKHIAAEDPGMVLHVLMAQCRIDPAHAAETAAGMYASRPSLRPALAAVPVFLPRPQFPVFLRLLPEPLRPVFLREFLVFLARCGDERLEGILARARQDQAAVSGPDSPLLALLAREYPPGERPLPPKPRQISPEPLERPEALGLLGKLKSLVGLEKAPGGRRAAPCPLDALDGGGEIVGANLSGIARPGLVVHDVVFSKTTLECVDLTQCVLSRVIFRDCRLRKTDFALARLTGVRFEACRLEHCRFSGIFATGLVFSGCDLFGTWIDDAEAQELRFTDCAVTEGDFFGSRLTDVEATQSIFTCSNFTRTAFSRARFLGVDLLDCVFADAFLHGIGAWGCHLRGTSLTDCAIFSLQTDEPFLLDAHVRSARDGLLRLAATHSPGLESVGPDRRESALAARLVESWYFDTETAQRRAVVLAHNRRRLEWAWEKLGEPAADFLRSLPGLMEAPCTFGDKGFVAAVPARIAEYHPGFTVRAAMQNIMGEACPPLAPAQNAVNILGLFAMGSLGGVAQGQASDLDIWVCLADDAVTRRQIDRFRRKMDGLRALAASRNIEAHFFVMTDADIRENRLGLGDEEQCGQARAMLLKEEFLRTAIFLAGRKPAWWFVSPGLGDEAYARTVSRLMRPGAPAATDIVDTGNVRRVADEAFFGASLWTIVKSLENPFKSIMKFALLEKYLEKDARRTLLCDRIKRRIFAGRTSLFDTDPYVLLFDEVRAFHEARGNREALALLRVAFIQKTGLDPMDPGAMSREAHPGQNGGEGLFRAGFFFDLDKCRAARQATEPHGAETPRADGVADLTAAGKKIADFLFGTYERIRERLATEGNAVGPETDEHDMAVFRRRIQSRFGTRKNKIGRIPFVRPPRGLVQSLEILSVGPEQGYAARGECRRPDGGKSLEHIRTEPSLERLAAWLVANAIHHPGVYLKAASVKAPLSLPDIQGLFAALNATFPVQDTFSPPLAQGLEAERITRTLLAINLHVPREEKDIVDVGLFYSTNWGELFFVEGTQALNLLEHAPHDFVRYNTGLDVDALARIETFIPAKAACPRLNPSFYGESPDGPR